MLVTGPSQILTIYSQMLSLKANRLKRNWVWCTRGSKQIKLLSTLPPVWVWMEVKPNLEMTSKKISFVKSQWLRSCRREWKTRWGTLTLTSMTLALPCRWGKPSHLRRMERDLTVTENSLQIKEISPPKTGLCPELEVTRWLRQLAWLRRDSALKTMMTSMADKAGT